MGILLSSKRQILPGSEITREDPGPAEESIYKSSNNDFGCMSSKVSRPLQRCNMPHAELLKRIDNSVVSLTGMASETITYPAI